MAASLAEGLWGLGVPQDKLDNLPEGEYAQRAEVKKRGVTQEQIDSALKLMEWRAPKGAATRSSLGIMLQTMGVDQATINKIIHRVVQTPDGRPRSYSDQELMNSVSEALGPQVATNAAIKLGKTNAIPQGAPAWNPYRTDAPKTPATTQGPMAPGHRPLVRPGTDAATGRAPEGGPAGSPDTGGGDKPPGNVTIQQGRDQGAPAPFVPKTDAEADKWIREKYGSYAWMLDDPAFAEVRDRLREGAKEGWDEQQVISKVKETGWWKAHEDTDRAWQITKKTDPPTAAAKLAKNKAELQTTASRLGIELSEADAERLADDYAKYDWQPAEVQQALASHAVYKPDFSGEIGAYETDIKSRARDFLMPINDEDAWKMAVQKAKGEISDDGIQQHFKEQAIGLLPSLKKYIDEGQIPRTLLGGHINQIAQLLEIEPDQVDFLGDSRFTNVLSVADEKAQGAPRIMTLTETQRHVRGLDDYYKTTNAHREVGDYMNTLKQTMGMG